MKNKKSFIIRLLTFLLLCCFAVTTKSQSLTAESTESYHERMEWFDEAKLGIFIHWGIYAVNGVAESWSFYNNQVPYDEYMQQTQGFTAAKYNPQEWAELIRESGAKYTVLTTKHHDGFALWDTQTGVLSAKKSSPAGRDLIAPFAEEVRKQGLKLGFYYSLLDWSNEDYPNHTKTVSRYDIKRDTLRWQKFRRFNFAQMAELNNKWKPDLYWFDGDWEQKAEDWDSQGIVRMLRSTNPNVIINSRIQGYGDYSTPEIGVPVTRPKSRYWELCYTINDNWGYRPKDTNFKTPRMLLGTFVECLSMGGNLLLDIGPMADGTIPREEVEILKAFGRWVTKHKEAVYHTRAGIPAGYFNGYTALNKTGDVLYLYLPYKPIGSVPLKGLINTVKKIRVVGTGTELNFKVYNKLTWSSVPGIVYIDIPEEVLDTDITVLAVQLDGPVKMYEGEGQVVTAN
jgi:alpha-L-fucosidase